MPFVRTAEDISRLQRILRRPTFSGLRSIVATFRTDPGVVRALLPPPLEPAEPLGRAWVCDVQASNVAGGFAGAGLDLAATHEGQQGWYCLLMPMSTDEAVRVGRETLGEPKKLCEISLGREGDAIQGTVTRRGVKLLTVDVTPTTDLGPVEQDGLAFHFKYLLACDGSGYDAPPQLVHATHHITASHAATGPAAISLGTSPHDPLGDIPVLDVGPGTYLLGEDAVEARVACPVDGEAFLPWAFANADDWLAFAEVQRRVHGLSARAASQAETSR